MLDMGSLIGSLGQEAYHYGRSSRYSLVESTIRFRNEVLDCTPGKSRGRRSQWQRGRDADNGG